MAARIPQQPWRKASASTVAQHFSVPSQAYGLASCGRKGSEASINPTAHLIPKTRIITRRLIRDLPVPRPKKPDLIAFVTEERLQRLKEHAKIVTEEEKEAEAMKKRIERDELREASRLRCAKMEEMERIRKQQAPLNDLEQEELEKKMDIRLKANQQRFENDEEIKEINNLILGAKVQAIRDDQVQEKQVIKERLKEAEDELNQVMEKERIEGLKREEEAAAKRKQEILEAAELLKEQIQANYENRIIEKHKKEKEGERLRKQYEKMLLEDMEATKLHKEKQKQLLETLLKGNEEIIKLKEIKKEESKQEDIMIAAYQRLKAEKEEAADAALKEKKRIRELEVAKLREQQERAKDIQAEKDALRARRALEEKERAYRKAEKEAVMKNKKIQEELQKYRIEEEEARNRLILLKAQQEQMEHQALLEKNRQDFEKEQVLRNRRRLEDLYHSKEIRKQIEQKEQEKINERREFFHEGFHKQQEEKIRRQRLDVLLQKKLDELEKYDIPESYVAHIKRKVAIRT